MGGHGAHADKPYYLHAKHMYNLNRMKYLRVKMPILVFTCLNIGVVVYVYVVIFSKGRLHLPDRFHAFGGMVRMFK
ncbi:hypothetical protein GIB67_032290 [Kingdonia uniflora]|uniref:Uncharacterized protein n=1 Tax=Kingdonia uniflora TaxID=39325 RepID=A0A7J7MX42_9MAGN|nr:hypothetical protein GIB67_032290 [Kingdonia uniflora]